MWRALVGRVRCFPFDPLPTGWGSWGSKAGGRPSQLSILQEPCLILSSLSPQGGVGGPSVDNIFPGCPAQPSGLWDEGWTGRALISMEMSLVAWEDDSG